MKFEPADRLSSALINLQQFVNLGEHNRYKFNISHEYEDTIYVNVRLDREWDEKEDLRWGSRDLKTERGWGWVHGSCLEFNVHGDNNPEVSLVEAINYALQVWSKDPDEFSRKRY